MIRIHVDGCWLALGCHGDCSIIVVALIAVKIILLIACAQQRLGILLFVFAKGQITRPSFALLFLRTG